MIPPSDISMREIVARLLGPILDRDPEPQSAQAEDKGGARPKRQIAPPTPEELLQIEALAVEVSELAEELARRIGPLGTEFAAKKKQLLNHLLDHGLNEVRPEGWPAIKVSTENKRDVTKKAMVATFGPKEGARIWTELPQKKTESLSISARQFDGPSE